MTGRRLLPIFYILLLAGTSLSLLAVVAYLSGARGPLLRTATGYGIVVAMFLGGAATVFAFGEVVNIGIKAAKHQRTSGAVFPMRLLLLIGAVIAAAASILLVLSRYGGSY